MSGINIIEKDQDGKGQLPGLLQEALQVSFDNSVGHDFEEDADARHDFYNRVESKLPVDLEMLKKITKDGIPTKTLNIIMAGTGVGKSVVIPKLLMHYFDYKLPVILTMPTVNSTKPG